MKKYADSRENQLLFEGDFTCKARVTPWTWNASNIRGQLTILKNKKHEGLCDILKANLLKSLVYEKANVEIDIKIN